MVQDLEDMMEGMSPTYERSQRLHDPEAWLPILTQGALLPRQARQAFLAASRARGGAERCVVFFCITDARPAASTALRWWALSTHVLHEMCAFEASSLWSVQCATAAPCQLPTLAKHHRKQPQ